MKITKAELIGEMKHYAMTAEINKGETILLIDFTLTKMYDANSDSATYELTDPMGLKSIFLNPLKNKKLKDLAIEWLEAKKCSVCGQPEDDDGRCGCTNADANA